MRGLLAFIFFLNFSPSFANNTILALVDNEVITLNSVEYKFHINSSVEEKTLIINKRIDTILQLQKVEEFEIYPSQKDINSALSELAKINEISLDQLYSYPEISLITQEIKEKLSILNLQRFITKELILDFPATELIKKCPANTNDIKIKQIKIAQIFISRIENTDASSTIREKTIKDRLNKLSKHINNGGSFESLAKLHSQHSSYANGGVSGWITINSPAIKKLDLLKSGEVSEIYNINSGFAIAVKIDERFLNNNLEKCKEKLTYIMAEKFYLNWLQNLRNNSEIEIYTNLIR